VDVTSILTACPGPNGIVSYADTATVNYSIRGEGKTADLTLILTAGQ